MDEHSRQIIAEREYKERKGVQQQEYTGNFNSEHYTEVKSTSIQPTQIINKEVHSTPYKQDFDNAARDFWQKNAPNALRKYNGGSITANFGREAYTIDEFLERIGNFIKESISNELIETKVSPNELQENFKAVSVSLKLLSTAISKLDAVNLVNVTAYMHGFINTYVDTIIKRKIEKGN